MQWLRKLFGLCIHDWDKWFESKKYMFKVSIGKYPVPIQKRVCKKCGLIQRRDLDG